MTSATLYIKPNITIDSELIGSKKFYIYNYKGVHYRVFNSWLSLQDFIENENTTWIYECDTENALEKYFHNSLFFKKEGR